MSHTFMPRVEALNVASVQPMHAARESRGGQLQHEMEMIGHQNVGGKNPIEPFHGFGQKLEKENTILIVVVNRPLFIASNRDVPQRTRVFKSQRSCHAPRLPRSRSRRSF